MAACDDARLPPWIGRRTLGALLLPAVAPTAASAREVEADALLIVDPWFRPLDAPLRSARAFVSVRNRAAAPDRLLYAWSPDAGIVELREADDGGAGGMATEGLAIPPDGSLVLRPDGPYLALREIVPDRRPTDDLRIALRFAMTGGILVSFRPRTA